MEDFYETHSAAQKTISGVASSLYRLINGCFSRMLQETVEVLLPVAEA
jgi:hypothetical protein